MTSLSRRGPINLATSFFLNINLTKIIKKLLLFQMSLKNDCINLYFHPYNLDERQKSLSYLTSLSHRSLVNTSTHTFPNTNLTKTINNLPIPPILSPIPILQKQLTIYLFFQMPLKNGCNNLYFHPYTFDERQESLSYRTSFYHRCPVNPSTPI